MPEETGKKPISSLGGTARAAKMTASERKESARKAAEARWSADLPRATHMGTLDLAGQILECAVLDDGRRVLSQQSFTAAIGRTGKPRRAEAITDDGSFSTPAFLDAANLKPFIDKYLQGPSATVAYRTQSGARAFGYEANLLPQVGNVYLAARRAGVVKSPNQKKVAQACEVLISALAQVGIDALVDEATGFQYSRTRDALQKILAQYVSKELARWEITFQPDFYKHLFRLQGWHYDPYSSKRPFHAARLTVNLIYARIHPDLVKELKQVRSDGNKPNSKLFQWLTSGANGGHPRLKQHLEGVTALMSVAKTWPQLLEWVDMRYPAINDTLRIPFPTDDLDEPDEVKNLPEAD